MVGWDSIFGVLVNSVRVKVGFDGVSSIVVGIKRSGGRDVGRGVWIVGSCFEGGGLIGRVFVSGDLVNFVGVMVGFVGLVYFFFGAERGGGRDVGRGDIYYVVMVIPIVYVMVVEG